MSSDVKVTIERKKAVTGAGDSVPLLFAGGAAVAVPYTECEGVDEVLALCGENSAVAAAANVLFAQENPPEKVAVFVAETSACESLPGVWGENWRQVLVAENAAGESAKEVAALVDARGEKVFFAQVSELSELDEGRALTAHQRCFCLYDPQEEGYAAAVLGASAAKAAGSFTYKNLKLRGVAPCALTSAQAAAVQKAGCACVVQKAGDVVTSDGACTGGEYLDIIDARDYIVREIEYRTQKLLNGSDKVPYDNNGIALLESVCVNVLAAAYAEGMIAEKDEGGGDYTVAYAPRSETAEEDRELRRYVEGRFSFALAGAVHTARIEGTILI